MECSRRLPPEFRLGNFSRGTHSFDLCVAKVHRDVQASDLLEDSSDNVCCHVLRKIQILDDGLGDGNDVAAWYEQAGVQVELIEDENLALIVSDAYVDLDQIRFVNAITVITTITSTISPPSLLVTSTVIQYFLSNLLLLPKVDIHIYIGVEITCYRILGYL